MTGKKTLSDRKRKSFETEEEREKAKVTNEDKSDIASPTALENSKYEPGHHMRVRDQDGRTKHRDYDGQGNHKPH